MKTRFYYATPFTFIQSNSNFASCYRLANNLGKDHRQSSRRHSSSYNGRRRLVCRNPHFGSVTAAISFSPDPRDSIEFTSVLIVNEKAYDPFLTVLTPGATANLNETWFVCPTKSTLVIRLIVLGRVKRSGRLYYFADISTKYHMDSSETPFICPNAAYR